MLVLTRKAAESVVFPALNITVTVVDIRGDRVRLGISGDSSIVAMRDELLERMTKRELGEFLERKAMEARNDAGTDL